MARLLDNHNRDEWPTRLFKMRGFDVSIYYDSMIDRMVAVVPVNGNGKRVELPDGYRSMTLEAFRHWVDDEVTKIRGETDFPAVSFNNVVPT